MGKGNNFLPRNQVIAVESGGLASEDIRTSPRTWTTIISPNGQAKPRPSLQQINSHYDESRSQHELARVRAYNEAS
jgi:hypothetical protein